MLEAVGGYQVGEEWRTQALIVAHRAAPEGQDGAGDHLLRISRNPLGALSEREYAWFCKARLAAVTSLAGAAREHPDLFCDVVASGRYAGGVFDVVSMPAARVEDIVERRVRCDPAALHRLLERILDATALLHERTGRAHGALRPASLFLDEPLLQWSTGVRIGEPPAAQPPQDGVAADLRALGRIMHLLAEHREPDPSVFSDDGDASAFRCFGRSGVRHRRLCADLLTASPARADFGLEEARATLRALRPVSPGARRAIRVGGAGVAVAAAVGLAVSVWFFTRSDEPLGIPPNPRQFDEAFDFALILQDSFDKAADPTLQARLDTPEFRDAIAVLSIKGLLTRDDWRSWFNGRWSETKVRDWLRSFHDQLRWSESNVAEWEAAYATAVEEVRARIIEPLRDAGAVANARGWNEQASAATALADATEALIQGADLEELVDGVSEAAALHAQLLGWEDSLTEARNRLRFQLEDIRDSEARVVIEDESGVTPLPVGEVVERWLSALALAMPGEAPDRTISRFEEQSAVAIEDVVAGADYWSTTGRFDDEQFDREAPRIAAEMFESGESGVAAFAAWRQSVNDPVFVNIGEDPRLELADLREALVAERAGLIAAWSDEEVALIAERLESIDAQIGSVLEPIDGLGAWSLENEQLIKEAVARAETRIAEGTAMIAEADSYLQEFADIELRRNGVITRAGELLEANPGWFDARLEPLIQVARVAQGTDLPQALDGLDAERFRLEEAVRTASLLSETVQSLQGNRDSYGDALRVRGESIYGEWRLAVPSDQTRATELRADINLLVDLRERATSALLAVDDRAGALAQEQGDEILDLASMLRSSGVSAAVESPARLFQVIDQLEYYLQNRGRWELVRDQLALDLRRDSVLTEVLWRAYEIQRDAETAIGATLTIEDVDLEQRIRGRLTVAFGALPGRLSTPAVAERLDDWIAQRPRQWAANTDIATDLAEVDRILTNADAAAGAGGARIAGARALREIAAYTPAEDLPEEEVRAVIQSQRERLAELRPQVPVGGDWDAVLGEADRRLGELEEGRGGPQLDEALLATIGPARAGWTLRAGSPIERPIYERDGEALGFVLVESADPEFYLATEELTLAATGVIARSMQAQLWNVLDEREQVIVKDWSVPDFQVMAGEPRGYWLTDRRAVGLQLDWLSPPASAIEGGFILAAHLQLMYGDDAGAAASWAPTPETPLHWVGFQGALSIARAVGCRLPTPQEWLDAYALGDLRADAPPNVSDAAWTRHVQRASVDSDVPMPDGGSYFSFDQGEARAAFQAEDDGWLWLRPIDPPQSQGRIFDMVGNVAEWADARALEREADAALIELSSADMEAGARIMGVSAMSGLGEPDQVVGLSRRARSGARQNLLANVRPAMGTGFADVGVRLAFGIGDAASKSLAGRYAQTMADLPAIFRDDAEGS